MRFFTYTMTSGSMVINYPLGVQYISIQADQATNGSFSVLGNIPFNGLQPNSVVLPTNSGVNFRAETPNAPIDGLTITWISGNVDIIIGL